MKTISSLRQEIDQVHQEIYALLVRRRDLTMQIWKIKQEQGLPFFNSDREEQILQDFVAMNEDQEKDPQFEDLLQGVMKSVLREYETYLRSKFSGDSN